MNEGALGLPDALPNPALAVARPKLASGTIHYVKPGIVYTSGNTTVQLIAGRRLYEVMVVGPNPLTVISILFSITTVAAAGKKMLVGIYSADTDWQPAILQWQSAEIAADVLGLVTVNLLPPLVLPPGRYLACLTSDGNPIFQIFSGQLLGHPVNVPGGTPAMSQLQGIAGVAYGPLPYYGVPWTNISNAATGFGHITILAIQP